MRWGPASLGIISLASSTALLVGCTPEPNGPPIEGLSSTDEQTYAYPYDSPTAPGSKSAIPEESGCRSARTANDKALKPALSFGPGSEPPQMDIHVTPIFEGSPAVDDVTLSDHVGKSWLNEWSHKVDSHKLLLTVVQNPGSEARELDGEDLEKVTLRHAEAPEGTSGIECESPIPVTTRFIGKRPADFGDRPASIWTHPTTIWEVSSDSDIASDPEQLLTAWVDGEELNQMGAVRDLDQGNDAFATLGDTPSARADLAYYYENR